VFVNAKKGVCVNYKRVTKSDLQVSSLCLGTVNYGTKTDAIDCFRQLDTFFEAGGNFIDTAHVYGNWIAGLESPSEKILGSWMEKNKNRSEIILATKGAHPEVSNPGIPRVVPKEIEKDLKKSLDFLKTDYIDLYFLHRDDESIPVKELIDFMDSLVKKGKIRYYGCSNWSLNRIIEAETYASKKNSPGFLVNQVMYSLADINLNNLPDKSCKPMDKATYAFYQKNNLNVMAYSSMAQGYFSKLARGVPLAPGLRAIYENASNKELYSLLAKYCETNCSVNLTNLSLGYIADNTAFVSVPIASFSTIEQLKMGLESMDKVIDPKLYRAIKKIKEFVC
jgi:aryl-alcohol dehydrogenase-like predicted oxidoreductase